MRGFTLVEMLAVFAIIALLSGIVFVGGRSGAEILALERSAHQVAQHLRKTGEFALGAELSSMCSGGTGAFSGYGISFAQSAPDRYILYGNCNGVGNEGYTANGPDADQVSETFFLDPLVQIGQVSDGGAWSVAFFPPEPRIALCTSDACTSSLLTAFLTLRLKSDPSKTKTIIINGKGTIDID